MSTMTEFMGGAFLSGVLLPVDPIFTLPVCRYLFAQSEDVRGIIDKAIADDTTDNIMAVDTGKHQLF